MSSAVFSPNIGLKLAILIGAMTLGGCGDRAITPQNIEALGWLRLAIVPSGPNQPCTEPNFELALAEQFARSINADLAVIPARNQREVIELLLTGKAHMGATGPPKPVAGLSWGATYRIDFPVLIYRRGSDRPRDASDIGERPIVALERAETNFVARELYASGHDVQLITVGTLGEITAIVDRQVEPLGLMRASEFEDLRRRYPEVALAIEFDHPLALTWLYRGQQNDPLGASITKYMAGQFQQGAYNDLEHRYFSHLRKFDYVEARAFLRHYSERLPEFRQTFIEAGEQVDIDWRLLAAVGYQESHWRQNARSPTGVRGLMMLTEATAKRMQVDRLDPHQSIRGGARYLKQIKDRLPERIPEPDRLWFALAGYNIGLGHLEDARVLADRAGADPDKWFEVAPFLLKLGQREWAEKTRFGRAAGGQARNFVRNVRRYNDVLISLEPSPQRNICRVDKPAPIKRFALF
ncbi:MAG: membrane-bound lytic murein transglycosylase MltF [Pseudomonadota bacterium]